MNGPRLSEKNKNLGTLLGHALENIDSAEKLVMSNASRVQVDPKKTRLNDLHNRKDTSMDGAAIQELMESVKASGQRQPAKGWRLQRPDKDGVEIVLISGARRRAVALALGIDLLVEIVTEPTDEELFIEMQAENKGRRPYFPLEDAYEWRTMLGRKGFETHAELAKRLGEDASKVSRTMTLLELPEEVLAAFKDPSTMPLIKGVQLARLLNESRHARERAIKAAREWIEMGGQGSPFAMIQQAAEGRAPKPAAAQPKKLLVAGKEVGRVQGAEKPTQDLRLVLSSACQPEARNAILAVLDQHFPEWRKTRHRG